MAKKNSGGEIVSNRKAYHDYEILDTYEAGIMLKGTEIKSIRENGASLQEAYVRIIKGELWLIGGYIAPYRFGNLHNHEERRDRKLLMHGGEITRLKTLVKEKGMTLVPLALYFKEGRVKIKIGHGRGKKKADKREALKEKDEKRHIQRALKNS